MEAPVPRQVNIALPELPISAQVQNKENWNAHRNKVSADFYTVGYSRRTASEIVVALLEAEVQTLIDVRFAPVSRFKPEFSKSNFSGQVARAGIEYLHRPDLGVPRDIRALSIETGDRRVIWEWYDGIVIPVFASRNLDHFFNFANHPVALMCAELDPMACHRHRLALALEEYGLQGYDL